MKSIAAKTGNSHGLARIVFDIHVSLNRVLQGKTWTPMSLWDAFI